jgi:hypothetical protein
MLRNGELIFTFVIVSTLIARLRLFARLRWRFAHWNLFHDGRSRSLCKTMPEPRRRFCDSRHALSLYLGLSRRHKGFQRSQQLWQLRDIRRDPACLVFGEQLGCGSSPRLFTGYSQAKPTILFLPAEGGWLWANDSTLYPCAGPRIHDRAVTG